MSENRIQVYYLNPVVYTNFKLFIIVKYLYYTMYQYLVKTSFLPRRSSPLVGITGLMSVLITFFCISILNIIKKDFYQNYLIFDFLFFIVIYFSSQTLIYNYFKKKEAEIIESISVKPLRSRLLIVILSTSFLVLFILLTVKLLYYDGNTNLINI